MDPNEALRNARAALSAHLAADKNPVIARGLDRTLSEAEQNGFNELLLAAATLAEAFEALDGWLSSGGFPPDAWASRASRAILAKHDKSDPRRCCVKADVARDAKRCLLDAGHPSAHRFG